LKAHFIAGWGGFPLVGTKEQVVDGLGLLSKVGFDGVILSWARYVEEMRQFQVETLRCSSRRAALRRPRASHGRLFAARERPLR